MEASAATEPVARSTPGYRVSLGEDAVEVRLCFAEPPGAQVLPHDASPAHLVDHVRLEHAGETSELRATQRGFALPPTAGVGDCIDYRVPLAKLRGVGAPIRTKQYDEDWLLCADYWLWHPERVGVLPLRFVLPPGINASFPWPRRGDHYLLPPDAHR